MEYKIEPVAKPRMTQRDRWKKRDCVLKYNAFKDECKLAKIRIYPHDTAVSFYLPMPDSWSKSKKEVFNNKPHQQKPDLDNLLKALFDAVLSNDNDAVIWNICASKFWAYEGKIIVK